MHNMHILFSLFPENLSPSHKSKQFKNVPLQIYN